jgi:hypothetical protein
MGRAVGAFLLFALFAHFAVKKLILLATLASWRFNAGKAAWYWRQPNFRTPEL